MFWWLLWKLRWIWDFYLKFTNPTSSRDPQILPSMRRAEDAQRGKCTVMEYALFLCLAAQPLPGSWPCREDFSPKLQFSHLKSVGDDRSQGCQELKWVTALCCVWRALCTNKCPLWRKRAGGLSWHKPFTPVSTIWFFPARGSSHPCHRWPHWGSHRKADLSFEPET